MKEKLIKAVLIIVVVLGIIVFFRIGYKIIQGMKRSPPLIYDVAGRALKKQQVIESIKFSGTVEGDPQVKIFPIINGKFERNVLEEGQSVKKNGIISYISRDEIGSYELVQVKSPVSGIITKIYYRDRGAVVRTSRPVAEAGNPDSIKVVIQAGGQDLLRIKKGQAAKIYVEDQPELFLDGTVDKVSSSVSRDNPAGQVVVKAGNRERKLMIGMAVNVEITTGQEDVYLVPERAVLLGQGRAYVYMNMSGTAKEVDVTTGNLHGRDIEISGPIADGDEVVTKGAFKLNDGARINFRKE